MRVSNHQVPASFLRLFEKMKFDGSRVNNFIQYDPEISELKLKHYNYIQHINGNPLKPEMAIKINETCLEILKPAFDQLQSNKSTTRKASLNYRALAINLLKLFHTYLHKYIHDDISFLIESKIVYPFGNRIGLIYNIPYEFNTREQLARLEAIRILVFHFERNCQKYADSIGGEDGLKFSCFEGRQGAMVYLVIWVTACNRNLFRNVVAPKSGDLYRMLGFSF